jgi:membrane fusion protein (multidrug efflux system)
MARNFRKMTNRLLLPVLAMLAGCGDDTPPPPPPPDVDVMTITTRPVPYTVELPARVQAMRTAEVRARVDGIIERRLYVEGTDIKAGTPMFIIDPREMRANYEAAKASLNRADSVLRNATQDVERYRPLVSREAISKQEYDAAVARAAQAAADVASARAQTDRARLDLNYASVTAPISGRAGRAQVTEGALVSASQATLLATIEQLDPIYVNFSQSSTELLKLRRAMETGQFKGEGVGKVMVKLILDDGSAYGPSGRLDFLDMAVDPSTGTVSLRAEFPNRQRLLLPGQFVRARVKVGSLRNGVVIPQAAVKMTGTGATVFVVGPKDVAVQRPVSLGEMQGSNWVVLDGLKAGERIIINGLQKVQPGKPVHIPGTPAAAPKPQTS